MRPPPGRRINDGYLGRRYRSANAAPMPSTTATARSIQARVKNTSRGCGTGGPEDIQKWNTAMASQASAPRIRSTAKATKRSPRAFMAREHKRKLLRVVDARGYFLFR